MRKQCTSVQPLASHANVLRGSSRVPTPRLRDEPVRTSAWEAIQPWALMLNCFVKHYGSKFLISEQEALCLTLEPYYICFLVLLWYFKVLWCHLAIDHLFQSVALSGGLFLRSQSETFKCSDLISNFWTRQIKKPWLKGIFLLVFKTF